MNKQITLLLFFLATFACDNNSNVTPEVSSLSGFWSRKTVYLNGTNSNEHVDFLNEGTNHLHLKQDKTFERAFDLGKWTVNNQTLILDREASSGIADWTYQIIEHADDILILETKLTEGQYCCDFDAFSDNEIITIREVYTRTQ